MAGVIDIRDVVDRLGGIFASLVERELCPHGRREGEEWVDADAPAGKGSTLRINLRSGVWAHYRLHSLGQRDGFAGDRLDLIAYVLFGGDKKRAWKYALDKLGIATNGPRPKIERSAAPPPREPDAAEAEARERKRKWAQAQFLSAAEGLRGTAAEWYLEGRRIELRRLERQPGALRFAAASPYPHSVMPAAGSHPAMCAAITGLDGTFLALHRTFLTVMALGRASTLATVPKAKIVTGRYAGGLVRLRNGTIENAETGEWREAPKLGELGAKKPGLIERGWHGPALDEIHLTEGIENALSLACACPDYRVAAAVSIANLARVDLPEAIARVVIWADNDPERDAKGDVHAATRALEKAVGWHVGHGRTVEIARCPEGFKDVNDYWRSVA